MKLSEPKDVVQQLREGKTLLYPTDTIWGLGCDASNAEAVDRIFEIKKRPANKSLVCLVSDDAMLNRLIPEVPEIAWQLFDEADKPLTLILPNATGIAPQVSAEDGSIAIRIIRQGPLHQTIFNLRKPLVSTSANTSGQPSPKNYQSLEQSIIDEVDAIATWGEQGMTGQASSIIKVELNGQVNIIRK